MIYKNSYFKKELRQAYIENQISTKRKLTFGAFLGLISIAVHFLILTMTDSVLSDSFSFMMQTTYFSTIYTYISISFLLYIIYFIVYYDYLSFAEIRKNRWYLLVKMGYNPQNMIFSKIIATLFSLFFIYTIGFSVTILMTIFLKYSFSYGYLLVLYIIGLLDITVISIIGATVSLFTNRTSNARYALIFASLMIYFLRIVTGYNDIVTTPNLLIKEGLIAVFNASNSPYYIIIISTIIICVIICFFRAKDIAKYYSLPDDNIDNGLPDGTKLARLDERTKKIYLLDKQKKEIFRSKMFDMVVTCFLIVFVCATVAFNVFIIIISASQPGKEISIKGIIPYVFNSDTMSPEIVKNDLAYFQKVDEFQSIEVGKIVLFKQDKEVIIQKVISIDGRIITVDFVNYPKNSEVGTLTAKIDRTQIYGVYTGRNRLLGALILFANTLAGRLLFLFVPILILFFYKSIKRFFLISIKPLDSD